VALLYPLLSSETGIIARSYKIKKTGIRPFRLQACHGIIAPRIYYSVLSRCSRGTGTTLAFIGRSELRGGANSVREQVEMLSIFGSSVLERMFYYLNYPFINQAQYKVSLLSLILLVGVILIASMVSRYLRGLLEKRLLPRWNIEIGLQYTLLRVVHYLIIILGVL